jgi:hypothetical protein
MKQENDTRLKKLIRMLGSRNEVEVLTAARALVSELQAIGKDLQALANLTVQWQKEAIERPIRQSKPNPVADSLSDDAFYTELFRNLGLRSGDPDH